MTTSAMTSQHLHARVARANAARGLRARVVAPAGRSIATARRSAIAVSAARAETDDAASAPASASSRRAVVLGGALALASSALAATTPVAIADEAPTTTETTTTTTRDRKSVVVTGSNSGIGLDGAAKLAARGYDVTLACRTLAKAQAAKASIEATAAANGVVLTGSLTPAECDLASLDSIRAFAASRRAAPLDALVLNAGVEFSGDNTVRRTADGFEITVGVNHLGHFLLTNLLLPDLEAAASASPQSDGTTPRVVVTASEVHDPASPGGNVGLGAGLGDLRGLAENGAAFEMLDGSPYDADKAYKDSKLCNVLFARELQRRLRDAGSVVTVNTFGPGLITRTGLFRAQNPLFVKVFDFATNEIFHVAETVDGGGDCLVRMVTDAELEGVGDVYYNNGIAPGEGKTGHKFERGDVSAEAMDGEKGKALWAYSERLVGLSA